MGIVHDQKNTMEKQMGCMAGIFQLFDRNQFGKRVYTTKRLPPTGVNTPPKPENDSSISRPAEIRPMASASQTPPAPVDIPTPPKPPLPLPIFELNESSKHSSWKFSPRLSLDSRATFDAAKGGLKPREIRTNATNGCDNNVDEINHRSPSVIARLMGLEPLPNLATNTEPKQSPQLRRCASESRVSRDIFQHRLSENYNHIYKMQSSSATSSNVIQVETSDNGSSKVKGVSKVVKAPQQRKSFFDSADFFPEPKQTVSISGEIESRLRMRGIDEPSKDLDTLKQILEAMQLKGLLHSKNKRPVRINNNNNNNTNIVCDRTTVSSPQSPIVLMKPNPVSPRRERGASDQKKSASSPTRNERVVKNVVGKKQITTETQKRLSVHAENGRVTSPRISPKRNVVDPSPRNRKPIIARSYDKEKYRNAVVIEDESCSSISESSISTPSQTDHERFKAVEYIQGRTLLERCDKLLHTIAEMNAADLQPSPVSVLDSSFYKDESWSSSSPSPVMKRSISFTDESVELEGDLGSPGMSSIMMSIYEDENSDPDFVYISEILRAMRYASEETDDIFLLLEKQQHLKGNDISKVSRLQRKLIFETITEILNRKRQVPISKALFAKHEAKPSVGEIWSELRKIRERETSEDVFEIVCGVLKNDLARDAINGWIGWPVERSEAVLDIERLIFKDLVGESIRDLAEFAGKTTMLVPRRKLVF